MRTAIRHLPLYLLPFALSSSALAAEPKGDAMPEKVSYYEHIRPMFQAKCQGCHQPAKENSDYIKTEFAALIAGG